MNILLLAAIILIAIWLFATLIHIAVLFVHIIVVVAACIIVYQFIVNYTKNSKHKR